MANVIQTALHLRDFNLSADGFAVDASSAKARAPSLPGTAKIRLNGDTVEASIDGSSFAPFGAVTQT